MRRLAWLLVLAACGHDAPPPKEHAAELGGGVVARVGSEPILASLVGDVARAQGIAPRAAMDGLVDETLAAQGGLAAGIDGEPSVGWPIVAAKARATAAHLRDDSAGQGPPTDAEIAELTARHWRQLDLPEGIRVVHAIALYASKRSPENDAAVKLTADRLAAAVARATTQAEFESLAGAVTPDGKVKTKVEALVFAVDGRSLETNGEIQASFVSAAAALHTPGAKARAESSYGLHVIQLIERLPEHRLPLEERRSLLAAEALSFRGRKAYEATLADLRKRYPVQISTAADALMQTVTLAQP